MGEEPVGDGLEGFGGEGFFDGGVFGGRAGVGVLEEMVEFGELADVGIFVAGIGEGFLDERHVDLRGDLQIFLAVEDEYGASGLLEIGERIVIEEEAEPWGRKHAELLLEGGRRDGGIHATGFDEIDELFVEGIGILFLANEVVSGFVEIEAGLDLRFGEIAGAGDEFGLRQQRVFTLGGGRAEENQPGDRFGARSEIRRDDGAFAVADNADFGGIDFLARLEVGDGGFGVGGQVESGRVVGVAGGFGSAALVVAKDGNSLSGEVVGEDEERLVIGDGFVAILRAGAGNEDGSGERTVALGKGEHASERDVGGFVGNGDFFLAVGVRLRGGLRPAKLERLIGPRESERGVGASL